MTWINELKDAITSLNREKLDQILRDHHQELRNVDYWNGYKVSPLDIAAEYNDCNEFPVLKKLLEAGAQVNAYTYQSEGGSEMSAELGVKHTALHWAILRENYDSIRMLVQAGADCTMYGHYVEKDTQSVYRGTCLEWAKVSGNHQEVELEIAEGKKARTEVPLFNDPELLMEVIEEGNDIYQKIQDLTNSYQLEMECIEKQKEELDGQHEALDAYQKRLQTKFQLQIAEYEIATSYQSEIQMEKLYAQLAALKADSDEDSDILECGVCFKKPIHVFVCQVCENWVCQNCKHSLARRPLERRKCPSCRADLDENPLKRSRAIERLFK